MNKTNLLQTLDIFTILLLWSCLGLLIFTPKERERNPGIVLTSTICFILYCFLLFVFACCLINIYLK